MSRWHTLNLGDALLADEALERLRGLFVACAARGEVARGGGLYVRHVSEGRLHCEVRVYFSPGAAAVAAAAGAKPCARPMQAGLGLLAGAAASTSGGADLDLEGRND